MTPRAMRTESAPANVSPRSLAASIALPPRERATRAAVIVRGPSPNRFDSRTRSDAPPMEVWTTWRSVAPASPGAGGMLRGSTSCCAAVHVPTQCWWGVADAGAHPFATAANAAKAATRRRPLKRRRAVSSLTGPSRGFTRALNAPPSWRAYRGGRPRRGRRPPERRQRLEPRAAVAGDERPQLDVRPGAGGALAARSNSRLVVTPGGPGGFGARGLG